MLRHYASQDESQRLFRSGHGRLELARTRELLDRYLPGAPATVLDVGGGTGVHAAWLADRGYLVHLIDPVPMHIQAAARVGTFTAELGNATSLQRNDCSADAVLLLGPLYHLVQSEDRLLALREAKRVLRPGGVLVASAIGRFMALLDWAQIGELTEYVAAKLEAVLASGVHDASLGFTDAYFHTATEFREEFVVAGFRDISVVGIEGPAWTLVDHEGGDTQQRFDSALRCARLTEDRPEIVDASAHLMAVGVAP